MASSVSLPLVVWHGFSNPNTTCLISSYPNVYAGQKDGTILVYTFSKTNPSLLQHALVLIGHKTSVAALCIVKTETDAISDREDVLISASEDGEVARWNTSDGRCLTSNPNGFFGVPSQLKVFRQFSERYIFCCGQSNEICILNTTTLEVVRVWGSHPNWVTCTDFYDPVSRRGRLATLTMNGRLDVWDFDVSRQIVLKDQSAVYQSLLVKDTNDMFDVAFDLISNEKMPSLCMALTSRNVIIFALSGVEFIPHVTLAAKPETSWTGGAFCGPDRCVLWTQNGEFYDYHLKAPEGIRPGIMVDESHLYYSAHLMKAYSFENEGLSLSLGSLNVTLCKGLEEPTAVLFCNRPTASAFCLVPLGDLSETKPSTGKNDIVTVRAEASFADVWPLKAHKDPVFGHITATTTVSSHHLALAYENGTICIVPVALALLHLHEISQYLDQGVRAFERAHDGEVTCMIVPENHQVAGHHYLLSGGRDGAVKIWNLIDSEYVASFTVHALPVDAFIEPAEQTDARIRGCVGSIARDNSLALISVESMNCLFIFPGYTCPLSTIQWRTTEDYMVLGYSDETAFVWQIQTAHLDRVLTGKQSRDALDDDRWPVNQLPFHSNSSKSAGSTKNTVSIRPLVSATKEIYAHVFTFNIRRLVHDLYTHLVNNPVRETSNGLLVPPDLKPSLSSKSFDSVPEVLAFRPDKDDPMDLLIDDDINPSASAKRKAKAEWRERRLELISAVMTVTMSWQVNEALEDVCKKALNKTSYNGHTVSNGIRSTNGYLSLLPPLDDEKEYWKISPSMTGVRLLSIALLAKAMIYAAGEDSRTSDLLSGYAMSLPAVIGSDYCFPSLSMLSKYWQDKSARSLFSSAVTGLSTEELAKLVHYWENFLPTSNASESHGPHIMVQATIILGIMGCDHAYLLTPSIRKSTALSLTLLLSDSELEEPRTSSSISADQTGSTVSTARTLASMELLSQGFSTWESYINAAEVLRTLFAYASDTQPSMASINRGAKQAIFHIAIANMPLVLGTLTYDTMHSKKIDERIQCLTMIGYFIRKKPMLLYSSVNKVAEAVVKTLDPNVAHMRESVLQSATSILHHLVKAYPCVDFSGSAQKLAVGTQEGAAVIYDLRTATRSVVLEGHMGPVDALAFSPDAKFIATCCLQDQTVRVWHTNLSLFGMLTSSLTQGLGQQRSEGKNQNNTSSSTQKPYKVFSFANPRDSTESYEILLNVHIEWTSARCIKLIVFDFVMSFPV